MSAAPRQLEFEVEWLELDSTKDTVRIVTLSTRARAWLDHIGVQIVVARLNAMGRATHEVGDAIQDLLEQDAGMLIADPDHSCSFARGANSEFAVHYEDAPDTNDSKIPLIFGLTPRARGWLSFQGDELAWRISTLEVDGELLESVCQRLLEADLGPKAQPWKA